MTRCLLVPLLLAMPLLSGCADLAKELNLQVAGSDERTAASTGPQERELYLDLITGLQAQDLHRAALAHLDEYDQRFSATSRSLRLRAESYTAVGEGPAAKLAWERLLGTSDEAAARNGLGRLAAQGDRWHEAAASFTAAVAKEPTNARYVNNLGYALLRAGDRQAAQFRLLQAEELDRESAEIRRNVVLVLLANGRGADADARLARIPDAAARATLHREATRAVAALPAARAANAAPETAS